MIFKLILLVCQVSQVEMLLLHVELIDRIDVSCLITCCPDLSDR